MPETSRASTRSTRNTANTDQWVRGDRDCRGCRDGRGVPTAGSVVVTRRPCAWTSSLPWPALVARSTWRLTSGASRHRPRQPSGYGACPARGSWSAPPAGTVTGRRRLRLRGGLVGSVRAGLRGGRCGLAGRLTRRRRPGELGDLAHELGPSRCVQRDFRGSDLLGATGPGTAPGPPPGVGEVNGRLDVAEPEAGASLCARSAPRSRPPPAGRSPRPARAAAP